MKVINILTSYFIPKLRQSTQVYTYLPTSFFSVKVFYITPHKPEMTIGKNKADICLDNDSSISRKHCVLRLTEKSKCPAEVRTKTGLFVTDTDSKYGTYLQDSDGDFSKLTPNVSKVLQHGSFIRFGIINHIYRWFLHLILEQERKLVDCVIVIVKSSNASSWLWIGNGDHSLNFSICCCYGSGAFLLATDAALY